MSAEDRMARIEDRLERIERSLPVLLGPQPDDYEDKARYAKTTERLVEGTKEVVVDRTQRTLTDGSPVPDDYSHTQDRGDGQQKGYIVLSAEELAKGFVRPVRRSYMHRPCGTVTSMGLAIAETYARDPGFYDGTFCAICKDHFPLDQFTWDGTGEVLGT